MVRFILEFENRSQSPLTLNQLELLHELKTMGAQSISELASAVQENQASVGESLTRLNKLGLVEPQGSGRGRRYHLSAAFFRTANASEYVHLKGLDPIQQEQMILSYLKEFNRITRSQAAKLCNLTPEQARSLLKRMTEEGTIALRGERRGSHYVLS